MNMNEYFLINAFTGDKALGNQACVMQVDDISNTSELQKIAANMNLAATTFITKYEDGYRVRWFAPMAEIDLCGHGTIAATWLLGKHLNLADSFIFYFSGGTIIGSVTKDGVAISSEAIPYQSQLVPDHVVNGFNCDVEAYFRSPNKHIVVLASPTMVEGLKPNWDVLRTSETFGYVVTAPAQDPFDCVSRVILPHISIFEDQATGSAHFLIAPYWSQRLNKSSIRAFQASKRGGEMVCSIIDSAVTLMAQCQIFAQGRYIP